MIMQILLIILCLVLLFGFLWAREKERRTFRALQRESRELERINHIASAILRNVHAYVLLIDSDFNVLKTNFYALTGTRKGLEDKRVGDLLQCRNALASVGGCGTHELCATCPVRLAIRRAFEQKKNFTDLQAALKIVVSDGQMTELDAIISGSYLLLDGVPKMVLTIHDVTRQKKIEKELIQAKKGVKDANPA